MALVAFFCVALMKKSGKFVPRLVGGVLAEILMVMGYFVFEGFLYGFIPSMVNIPANSVQGTAGIILGVMIVKILEKTKISKA